MKDSGSPRDAAPLGARNDDSSLFSLDSLQKSREAQKKHEQGRDDSGLIDLKALAAMERDGTPKAKGADVVVPAIVAPADLFSGPAAIAPMTAAPIAPVPIAPVITEPPPKPKRTGLIVALGGLAAIAACAGVFAMTRDSGAAASAATATVTAAPPPPPPATVAPSPPPAADDAKTAAVTPGERPAPGSPKAATAAAATASPAAAPKPATASAPKAAKAAPKEKDDAPPAKPVETCDLACQMQRAVDNKK